MVALVAFLLLASTVVSATPTFNSEVVFSLSDQSFWAPACQSSFLEFGPEVTLPHGSTTLTAIPFNTSVVGEKEIASFFEEAEKDDVWTGEFLKTVLLFAPEPVDEISISDAGLAFLYSFNVSSLLVPSDWRTSSTQVVRYVNKGVEIKAGPGVINFDLASVRPVLALQVDSFGAFIGSAFSIDQKEYSVLHVSSEETTEGLTVAYPSRLQALCDTRPLVGLRFGVKDIYNVEGLRTGGSNRAYQQLYPPANATAYSIQKLLAAGATLVGKTKTSMFAFHEDPTADFVDVHASFNARGDGYNSATSSSVGSAAAMAAYDFLDFAIGSDTGGSVRSPAAATGLYGLRPSTGAIDLANVLPQAASMDTAGPFTRDPRLFTKLCRFWYGSEGLLEGPFAALPPIILRPVDFLADESATAVIDQFFSQVEAALGIPTQGINISSVWDERSHAGEPIATWAYDIFATLTGYYSWTFLGKPFFKDYAAVNEGRTPFVNPQVRIGWDFGINQTEALYNDRLDRMATFADFWKANIVTSDNVTCSSSLIAFPYMGDSQPTPRDAYLAGAYPLNGWLQTFIAPYNGAPEVVLPIGQVARVSTHNNGTSSGVQYLPVTINVQAYPGCDYVLFDFIDKLADAGILKTVKTGSLTF